MEEAAAGKFFTTNPFTVEQQSPRLVQPIWLIGGLLMRVTGLPVEVVFQIYRIIAAVFFMALVWWLTHYVGASIRLRTWAFGAMIFSSGLGWIQYIVFQRGNAFDLWVSEASTFLTIMHSPLFMISQILLIVLLLWWWKIVQTKSAFAWWGALAVVLAVIHPYDILPLAATCFVLLLVSLRNSGGIRRAITVSSVQILWMLPVAGYYYWVLQEPTLRSWMEQNIDPTPPLYRLVLGLGVLGIALCLAWLRPSIRRRAELMPLLVWPVVAIALSVLPSIHFQRRLLNGIQLPLSLLACILWVEYARHWKPMSRELRTLFATFFLSCTSVIVIVHYSLTIAVPSRRNFPVWLTADQQALVQYISTQDATTSYWSNAWLGNTVAGLTTHQVALGHGHQTTDVKKKFEYWRVLSSATTTPQERQAIISQTTPLLLWEVGDGSDGYTPQNDPHWEKQWSQGTVTVYYWRGAN
jgi:hypothetical protein